MLRQQIAPQGKDSLSEALESFLALVGIVGMIKKRRGPDGLRLFIIQPPGLGSAPILSGTPVAIFHRLLTRGGDILGAGSLEDFLGQLGFIRIL